jgi:hypothetical protein
MAPLERPEPEGREDELVVVRPPHGLDNRGVGQLKTFRRLEQRRQARAILNLEDNFDVGGATGEVDSLNGGACRLKTVEEGMAGEDRGLARREGKISAENRVQDLAHGQEITSVVPICKLRPLEA